MKASFAVVLLGLLVLAPFDEAAARDTELRGLVEAVILDEGIQGELPRTLSDPETAETPDPEPGWPDLPQFTFPTIEGLDPVSSTLAWVLIIAGAALLLLFLARGLGRLDFGAATGAQVDVAPLERPGGAGGLPPGLEEAETLAAGGRYAEAVRVLLAALIALFHSRLDPALGASLTSREIERRVVLPDEARAAFVHIVAAVEVSHFGGRAVDETAYQRCRERYQQVAAVTQGAAG